LVGVLDGVVTDGVLLSGHSAPFGGPDLGREDAPVEDVVAFVEGALAAARAGGIREVRIRARPAVYSAAEPLLEYVLHATGFSVEHCDLNMHVDLTPLRAGADATVLLKDRKRRYVRAALAEPYEFGEVTGGEDVAAVHGIVAANRAVHGRPEGLAREYLERAKAAFPDRIRFFLLRRGGRPVASAVVYRVLEGIDQVVHWADAPEHGLQKSPMDLRAYFVYRESARSGARLLDLGPSSEKDGSPNVGLARFKRSVGAVPGARKVLVARP
jgi:hypothetical protein